MGQYYVGVDVGGTTVKMGLFSDVGELLEKWEIPTCLEDHGSHVLTDIVDSIESKRCKWEGNIRGIGVGIPGPVTDDGVVLKCANLGWGVFSVKNELAGLTGVGNVKVANDANVAALGEMWRRPRLRQYCYGYARNRRRWRHYPSREDIDRKPGRRRRDWPHKSKSQRDAGVRLRQSRMSGAVCISDRHCPHGKGAPAGK